MSKNKKIIIAFSAILSIMIVLLGIVAIINSTINNSKIFFNQSDDELILGCWRLEKEERDFNGLDDYLMNGLDERIQEIIFYSDGLCTVGGQNGQDDAAWSLVDEKIRINGNILFHYDNFISDYELDNDELIIYQNSRTDTYYRIEQSDLKWIN